LEDDKLRSYYQLAAVSVTQKNKILRKTDNSTGSVTFHFSDSFKRQSNFIAPGKSYVITSLASTCETFHSLVFRLCKGGKLRD